MRSASRIALVVVLAFAGAGLTAGASGKALVQLSDIEDEVMCPICGTALGLSQSPQADRERAFIRSQIRRGESKQQIKDALVAQYGREVLATPSGHGFDLVAWVAPLAGFMTGAIAVLIGVRRWRRGGGDGTTEEPISQKDSDRLDGDLARYDL